MCWKVVKIDTFRASTSYTNCTLNHEETKLNNF